MACFEWISARALPAQFDLGARGWRLARGPCREPGCARLIDGPARAGLDVSPRAARRRSLVLGVMASDERARLLDDGFADALGPEVGVAELEARARRVIACPLPALRAYGRLVLDLGLRDARVDGARLFLFPREFALLWRLAEAGGRPVPRAVLLRDVLGLRIEPRTNALAVHVCRLRKKLHVARLAHLLVTAADDGGYALVVEGPAPRNALDDRGESGEEEPALEEAAT